MSDMMAQGAGKPHPLTGPTGFWAGLRYEWSKIAWPIPSQLLWQTAIVLTLTTGMTLLVWGLDWFWRIVIEWIVPGKGL